MPEHFMRQQRKIVALGRQQAFPVYGLSKSSLDALRVHQAGSLPHTAFQPANDIVLANIALVKTLSEKNPRTNHSQGQSTSSDIYAGVASAAEAHEHTVWHWQPSSPRASSLRPLASPLPTSSPRPSSTPRTPSSLQTASPFERATSPFRSPSRRSSSPLRQAPVTEAFSEKTATSLMKHVSRVQAEKTTTFSRIVQEEKERPMSPIRPLSPLRRSGSPPPPLCARPPRPSSARSSPTSSSSETPPKSRPSTHEAEAPRFVLPSPFRLYNSRSGQRLLWGIGGG